MENLIKGHSQSQKTGVLKGEGGRVFDKGFIYMEILWRDLYQESDRKNKSGLLLWSFNGSPTVSSKPHPVRVSFLYVKVLQKL